MTVQYSFYLLCLCNMKSCLWFSVFPISFLLACSVSASPLFNLESATAQALVPIVNECNGLPELFKRHWHYRNVFNVIIKEGSNVKFELLNPNSIGNGEFSMTCFQNSKEEDLKLTFSKSQTFLHQVNIDTTCVPTLGVLKLCNSTSVNPIVILTVEEKESLQPLPVIEFKSFETYSYNIADVEKFLRKIDYYGFVKTPRAQVLITKAEANELQKNNIFLDGLKVINDVIEKYFEYSGRSSISIPNGPRINMALEKEVLLLKSEECQPGIFNPSIEDDRFIGHLKNYLDDVHLINRMKCSVAYAYYNSDQTAIINDDILGFFTPDAKKWAVLHEIGHHFDIHQRDDFIDVAEVWNNLYASFYQSRFVYKDEFDYWMQEYDANLVKELYQTGTPLQQFPHRPRAHFLMALFTLDNHDSSVFRSYNIRVMKDGDIVYNILRSIAVFIKDRYNINVVPFIEQVIYKGTPWLNITNIYDLANSQNFRMPCFYYPAKDNYPGYQFDEHNVKSITHLRLCSTITQKPKKIKITINNTELRNKQIEVNSNALIVLENPIEIDSYEEMFVFGGAINKSAVILPTYVFCSSEDNYKCTVTPQILTYDDQNPSQLIPPFVFNILGLGDEKIALLQIDMKNNKMLIKTLVKDGHPYFPSSEGAYVEIKLYDTLKSLISVYKINGTDMPVGDTWFNIKLGYTFELIAREKDRVKILDYNLNNFENNMFEIDKVGVTEVSERQSIIRQRFIQILSKDLEYKPYLKDYQHLTDLLRIMKNAQ